MQANADDFLWLKSFSGYLLIFTIYEISNIDGTHIPS